MNDIVYGKVFRQWKPLKGSGTWGQRRPKCGAVAKTRCHFPRGKKRDAACRPSPATTPPQFFSTRDSGRSLPTFMPHVLDCQRSVSLQFLPFLGFSPGGCVSFGCPGWFRPRLSWRIVMTSVPCSVCDPELLDQMPACRAVSPRCGNKSHFPEPARKRRP